MVRCRCGVWTNLGLICSKCSSESSGVGEDYEVSLDEVEESEEEEEEEE